MKRLPIYLLAGGRSRRFGSDKARAIVGGDTLLRRVASMLEPAAAGITVVADRAGKYDDLGFRTIGDLQPGLGPLGGLDTALRDLPPGDDWLLLCCCDALVIRQRWLASLVGAIGTGIQAVAFRDEYWQPMPGVYARAVAPAVADHLGQGKRSMQALLSACGAVALPLPDDWPANWQANAAADVEAFRAASPGPEADGVRRSVPTAARGGGYRRGPGCHQSRPT